MSLERKPVTIDLNQFLSESLSLVESAQKKGLVLRILGGFAVYIHSEKYPECRNLQLNLGRLGEGKPPFTDLDLGAYNNQWKEIKKFLENECKLKPDRMVNALFGGNRLVYFHPASNYPVDVFFDKLEYSHDVSFGEFRQSSARLELDYPTIDLATLMLEKLQIHQINKKDIIDMMVLLLGHEILMGSSKDSIDASYISKSLSADWGFYYDATNNLESVRTLTSQMKESGRVSADQSMRIVERLDTLKEAIAREPKTPDWKIRERVGTRRPWFREVSDL